MAQALDLFLLFPQLPTELRLKIWSLATPHPRIIELFWNSQARSVCARAAPVPLLQVCRESRIELSGFYDQLHIGQGSPIMLVKPHQDTLFFGPSCNHIVPNGNSSRWVKMNPKMIRDILRSSSLDKFLTVAFDSGFLLALQKNDEIPRLLEICRTLKSSMDAIIVRTGDWVEAKEEYRRNGGSGMKFKDVPRGILNSEAYKDTRAAFNLQPYFNIKRAQIMTVEVLKSTCTSVVACSSTSIFAHLRQSGISKKSVSLQRV